MIHRNRRANFLVLKSSRLLQGRSLLPMLFDKMLN